MAQAGKFIVETSTGVPIYRQLMNQVCVQIGTGRLTPGELLPSVRQVAEELQINPMTVSKAYSLLERDGVLRLVRGQGMQVAEAAVPITLKERRAEILPLLEQLVAKAAQLSLTEQELLKLLTPMLKEIRHADPAGDRDRGTDEELSGEAGSAEPRPPGARRLRRRAHRH